MHFATCHPPQLPPSLVTRWQAPILLPRELFLQRGLSRRPTMQLQKSKTRLSLAQLDEGLWTSPGGGPRSFTGDEVREKQQKQTTCLKWRHVLARRLAIALLLCKGGCVGRALSCCGHQCVGLSLALALCHREPARECPAGWAGQSEADHCSAGHAPLWCAMSSSSCHALARWPIGLSRLRQTGTDVLMLCWVQEEL